MLSDPLPGKAIVLPLRGRRLNVVTSRINEKKSVEFAESHYRHKNLNPARTSRIAIV